MPAAAVFSRRRLLRAIQRDGVATSPDVEYANRAEGLEEMGTVAERLPGRLARRIHAAGGGLAEPGAGGNTELIALR